MWRNVSAFTTAPSTFIGISAFRRTSPRCNPHRARRFCTRATIDQEVSQKIKQAMKDKDANKLRALRGIRAAFLTASKETGASESLGDEQAIAQLRKLAKMRKESIEMFEKGGREDLAEEERSELAIIENWLPSLADESQVRAWVEEAIAKTGAKGKSDMGKVMGVIMKDHRQDVDGGMVKNVVSELLV